MKKEVIKYIRYQSISDAHRVYGLPMPVHPLISLINSAEHHVEGKRPTDTHILGFYKISYRAKLSGKLKYGQGHYDFDEGGLLFASPNQVIGGYHNDGNLKDDPSIYTLLIHPDFLLGFPLFNKIKNYGFFSYATNEALHLSETEKATIISVFSMMETELNSRIDNFSQQVVVSQIELLLNFAERFYNRQFITRKAINTEFVQKVENLLNAYFNNDKLLSKGIPTVTYLAENLCVSSNYLSDMLRTLTGQNAQQHIHAKVIEKAKEILSTTSLSVNEVAYTLGFEYSQSFGKLFKNKTNLTPLEFRKQFN